MRISATGRSNNLATRRATTAPAPSGGFTLIEILVVVVIIGIISAVVLLSTNLIDDDREVRQEARRLTSLIELAADEALLQGRDLGIEFVQNGYRFVEYDPYLEQWFELAGDDLLRPRSLGEGLRFELFVEDRRVLLAAEHALLGGGQELANRRDADYAPHALIMSSGQLTPFDLQIMNGNEPSEFAIEVTPAGDIEVADGTDDEA